MRKSTALGFALCGTLLVILLFIAGRMLYLKFYHQSFTDIAGDDKLTANRLTVTFENGSSISVNADGFVFVDGKLCDIEGGRGQEFYHKLYILFYPNAT